MKMQRQADFEGEPLPELIRMADFLASQVGSMDSKSVAYGTYATSAFGPKEGWIRALKRSLLLRYRKDLIQWMEFALLKRANLGGGGTTIQKIEKGLADYVGSIPDILLGKKSASLADYIPNSEYFVPHLLDPVNRRILTVVRSEAVAAGVLSEGMSRTARQMEFSLQYDPQQRVWYIPPSESTFPVKDLLSRTYRFRWNPNQRRWETPALTPAIRQDFNVDPQGRPLRAPPAPAPIETFPATSEDTLKAWYFDKWLPRNINRFTKVFTEYARSKQSSYKMIFSVAGSKVTMVFDRDINTPLRAVEELRYRYTNRQGREAWLEVLDKFLELVAHTSPDDKLMMIIDRINNLQHSNGLFMEHFPPAVKGWYLKFLNAKYHAPTPDELAKYIPDRDLKNLLVEFAHYLYTGTFRAPGYQQTGPGQDYESMEKEEEIPGINWRIRNYPYAPGLGKVDRFDSRVQRQLDILRELDVDREALTLVDPELLEQIIEWKTYEKEWKLKARQADNFVDVTRDTLKPYFSAEDVEEIVAPLKRWVIGFKGLMTNERKLPTTPSQVAAYKQWIGRVKLELAELRRIEEDIRQTRLPAEQSRRERELERELEQRSTILAARYLQGGVLSEISQTILQQMGGYGKLRAMLGLGRPPYLVSELSGGRKGVRFMWPNPKRSQGNMVEIEYNPGMDLYEMTFLNVSVAGQKKVKHYQGLYAEDLVPTFERQTGWHLRM